MNKVQDLTETRDPTIQKNKSSGIKYLEKKSCHPEDGLHKLPSTNVLWKAAFQPHMQLAKGKRPHSQRILPGFFLTTATAALSSSFTVRKALVMKHGIFSLSKVVRSSVLTLICREFTHFKYQRICLRQEYKFKAGESGEITALMNPFSRPETPLQTLSPPKSCSTSSTEMCIFLLKDKN